MGGRVLVVEDEAELAEFLVQGLREEGFAAEHSADGRSALHRLRYESWDVVLLDWRLPKIDGLEVLKQIRQINQTLPILFLTARDAVADRVQGLDAGADDYLCKPFAFDELLARVRALTRRFQGALLALLKYHDVTINLLSHQAERDGTPLGLTAKEEALLAYFVRHPDEVLSRQRLFEEVWMDRYDPTSNTIEVHIGSLRSKLESGGRHRLIHTVRHAGYRFGEPQA